LEELVNDWGKGDSEEEDDEGRGDTPRKVSPTSQKKKLLSEATWKRDAQLHRYRHQLREALGDGLIEDHNVFLERVDAALKKLGLKLSAADLKLIINAVSWRVEDAPAVIKKIHKPGKTQPDPLRGLFEAKIDGKTCVVEYEPDSELRDYEQIPLLEEGGIEAFIRREVLPYTPDAWIVEADTKIGYEVSFTRHFYQPPQLRTLAEISADILALEQETEGLLSEITRRDVLSFLRLSRRIRQFAWKEISNLCSPWPTGRWDVWMVPFRLCPIPTSSFSCMCGKKPCYPARSKAPRVPCRTSSPPRRISFLQIVPKMSMKSSTM
jgi:hypothetical protein